MTDARTTRELEEWNARERLADEMVPVIGSLYRERSVGTYIFGQPLFHRTPIEILKAHRFARQLVGAELEPADTLTILRALSTLNLEHVRVDLGALVLARRERGAGMPTENFVAQELGSLLGHTREAVPRDVVLYGFGRIGRLLARILVDRMGGGDRLRLRAIVVRKKTDDDLEKRASLLRHDSVHGAFKGTILVDHEHSALVVNGNLIHVVYSDAPESVDYASLAIDHAIVLDNTGKWRDRESLGRHLDAKGVDSVILTAPGTGDIPNIVYGVNHEERDPEERLLSAASCTTNAVVPTLAALLERFGIAHGHLESCHAYTNDQNLIDGFHKKSRRGRSAALNMVLTETGAASAAAKALPALAGKLTANAIRVPTPNVSLAILNLMLEKETTKEELNETLRQLSLEGPLRYQLDFTASPDIVSSDLVGNRFTAIVDSANTIVEGKRCVLYLWYDNEYGYAWQVMRLLTDVAGVMTPGYPD